MIAITFVQELARFSLAYCNRLLPLLYIFSTHVLNTLARFIPKQITFCGHNRLLIFMLSRVTELIKKFWKPLANVEIYEILLY